jgi:hypothetical protein
MISEGNAVFPNSINNKFYTKLKHITKGALSVLNSEGYVNLTVSNS